MNTYMTTIDAAAFLCTHPSVLRQARMSGFLFERPAPTFYKIGTRKTVYRLDELEAFIESGRVIPESQSAAKSNLPEARRSMDHEQRGNSNG